MRQRRRIARLALAFAFAFALASAACASAPGEVERLRAETELLREQIRLVKQNCSYYRDVEMEIEEEPPASR